VVMVVVVMVVVGKAMAEVLRVAVKAETVEVGVMVEVVMVVGKAALSVMEELRVWAMREA